MATRLARALSVLTLLCVALFLIPEDARAQETGASEEFDIEVEIESGAESGVESEAEADPFGEEEPTANEGESAWQRSAEIGTDVLLLRPLLLCKMVAGMGFVLPASYIAGPSSMDTREEVVDVFWTIPLQDLTERELGDI